VTIRTDKPRAGFSLVELLLTLVLILCIAAASVFTFTTLYRSANLDEGYDRFQSLIRFAQAEAATTGRKVRLQFPAHAFSNKTSDTEEKTELRDIQVTWEADALNAPGVFQAYTNKSWSEEIVNELVGVQKVQSIQSPSVPEQSASVATLGTTSEESSPETVSSESSDFPAITFYPDGSCDSAEIVLASRNPDDERRMEVRLSGMLGSVSSRTISSDEADTSEDADDADAAAEFDEVFSSPQTTTALSDTSLN
jgi:prepilin-type N-terminal cleavage/methylation domain-containing protein